jgi:hypothetical protein
MNTWAYPSIQDFLVALGFSIDQEQSQFSKWHTGWQFVAIPFSELAGHTVVTFREKAQRRGWILAESNAPSSEQDLVPCV